MKAPAYVHYTDTDFLSEFMDDMRRPCPISGAADGHLRVSYELENYDFRQFIAAFLLDEGTLTTKMQREEVSKYMERLHEYVAPTDQQLDTTQHNAVADSLYSLEGEFRDLYQRFLEEVIVPAIGMGAVHWQAQPTFRVFFPHAGGYPGKTTYHSDLMLGHNPREVNVFLPFTSCEDSRSLLLAPLEASLELYAEFDYNFTAFAAAVQTDTGLQELCAGLCQPVTMDVGEVLLFDCRCLHAGPPNNTGLTRMTTDFRLLPQNSVSKQRNSYRGTGRTKALFAPGGVFTKETLP